MACPIGASATVSGESLGEEDTTVPASTAEEAAVPVSETNPCGVDRSSTGTRAPGDELALPLDEDGKKEGVVLGALGAGCGDGGPGSCEHPAAASAANNMAKACLFIYREP
jgi:hypothetical protein